MCQPDREERAVEIERRVEPQQRDQRHLQRDDEERDDDHKDDLAPRELQLSESIRLRRLSRGAKYKEDFAQLVLPLPRKTDPSQFLVQFLRDLIPVEQ